MDINSVPSEASPSSSKPEGVYLLRVVNQNLAIQGLRQILGVGTAADHLQKNSVLAVPKNWENLRHLFPPGAVAEDVSSIGDSLPVPADKIAILQNSLNTTTTQNTTASGAGSIAAQYIHIYVLGADFFKRAAPLATPSPHQPTESVDIKAALLALYTSKSFKKIERLVDPLKSVAISKSFIRLAVVLEETFAKAQKESLEAKEEEEVQNLNFICLNSHEAILLPKELIEIGKLFAYSDLDRKTPSRLLILGAAGMGKSTLCQYLANTWAEHPELLGDWQEKFSYLFLIRLRDLASYTESVPTLGEAIQKSMPQCSLEGIEKILSTNRDKILFLFDGYDEITAWLGQDPRHNSFFQDLLQQPHCILTSRPNYFDAPTALENCRQLEVVGFTREDVKKYIDQFFQDSGCSEKGEYVHQLLAYNPRVGALAHIPLNLELICSLWEMKEPSCFQDPGSREQSIRLRALFEMRRFGVMRRFGENIETSIFPALRTSIRQVQEQPFEEPYTMTKLYSEISGFLFESYISRKLGQSIEGVTLSYIAANRQYQIFLGTIEAIAWKGMLNGTTSLVIDKETYEPVVSSMMNAKELSDKQRENFYSILFTDLGFFRRVPSLKVSKRPHLADYYFIHLTFQEYFAARYFVREFLNELAYETGDWKEFIAENKFNPKFSVVFRFVAGLLGEKVHECRGSPKNQKKAKDQIDAFLDSLISKPRSLLGLHEIALVMHCSEEVEGVVIPSQQKEIEEFSKVLKRQMIGRMGKWTKKSFSTLFRGFCKFYSLDVEKKILQTLRQVSYKQAFDAIEAHQLLVPGVFDFLVEHGEEDKLNAGLQSFFLEVSREGGLGLLKPTFHDPDFKNFSWRGIFNRGFRGSGGLSPVISRAFSANYIFAQPEADALREQYSEGGGVIEEVVIRAIRNRGCATRTVIEIVVNLDPEREMETLIELLADDRFEARNARAAAALCLGNLDLEAEIVARVAEALIEVLSDDRFEGWNARAAAALYLGNLDLEGEMIARVAEALIKVLSDDKFEARYARAAAAQSLGNLDLKGEMVVGVAETLIKVLWDDRLEAQDAWIPAIRAFAHLDLEKEMVARVAEALIKVLWDDRLEAQDAWVPAIQALGNLDLEKEMVARVAEALIKVLWDDRLEAQDAWVPAIRAFARLDLEKEMVARVAEALIEVLSDDRLEAQDAWVPAIQALDNLDLENEMVARVAEALIELLADDRFEARNAWVPAIQALGNLDLEKEMIARAAKVLIKVLLDDRFEAQAARAAAEVLGILDLEGETFLSAASTLVEVIECALENRLQAQAARAAAMDVIFSHDLESEISQRASDDLLKAGQREKESKNMSEIAVKCFKTLVGVDKVMGQARAHRETAVRLCAYKIFFSQILCYHSSERFHYFENGKMIEVPMDENFYKELECFIASHFD